MALAKTDVSGSAGCSAKFSVPIATMEVLTARWAGTPRCSINGGGGTNLCWFEYQTIPPPPGDPWDGDIRLHSHASSESPGHWDHRHVGYWHSQYPVGPGYFEWYCALEATCSAHKSPLDLYCEVDRDSEMLGLESGPSSPCHPNHGSIKYAYGSDSYSKECTADISSDSVSGLTLTPVWGPDGSGTTDAIGGAGFWLGMSDRPQSNAAEGMTMASITDINYYLGSTNFGSPTFPTIRYPASGSVQGLHLEISGDAISLVLDDYDEVPLGGSGYLGVTVQAPVVLQVWPRGYNWNAAYSGMLFDVPKPHLEEVGSAGDIRVQTVESGYNETLTFWHMQVGATVYGWRPWQVEIAVNAAWAAANDENVTP